MKTKYEDLIKQLERATEVYNQAVYAAKRMASVIDGLDDVLGVQGSVDYMDGYDINRAIHVASRCFTQAAIDCGSDFKMEGREDHTRFECSMFGYRVFSLLSCGESGYAELLEKVEADE
ncbi:MAG TPA: hypothetical protein PLZ58_03965 [Candidatus Saccharibacteria bacterium]|nr:hypothetical protein [Candidatus Saccharibacteria bacterium]